MFRRALITAAAAGILPVVAACSRAAAPSTAAAPAERPAAASPAPTTRSAAAAPAASTAPAVRDSAAAIEYGREITYWLWTADVDAVWPRLAEPLRENLRTPSALADQIFGFVSQFGVEEAALEESVTQIADQWVYRRLVRTDASEEPWVIGWTFTADRTITDVDIQRGE